MACSSHMRTQPYYSVCKGTAFVKHYSGNSLWWYNYIGYKKLSKYGFGPQT